MKRLLVSFLAMGLVAATAPAGAQSYGNTVYSNGATAGASQYDYARVIRVDPVYDSNYGYSNSSSRTGQRCYENRSYVDGDVYNDGYGNNGYNDGYARDRYGNPVYQQRAPTTAGSTAATVVGGIVGAVIGSQVGGGSVRYATSAIGSMVGGMAGKQIYDRSHTTRSGVGTVRVCDPVPADGRYYPTGNDRVASYDVTYEYAGHRYVSRTNYNPGDRIRVRVDVRPE